MIKKIVFMPDYCDWLFCPFIAWLFRAKTTTVKIKFIENAILFLFCKLERDSSNSRKEIISPASDCKSIIAETILNIMLSELSSEVLPVIYPSFGNCFEGSNSLIISLPFFENERIKQQKESKSWIKLKRPIVNAIGKRDFPLKGPIGRLSPDSSSKFS